MFDSSALKEMKLSELQEIAKLAKTIKFNGVKKEALKTPLQGIVASLEGMKIRKDREVLLHLTPYPKLLILGEKDPVLNYEETKEQIENTAVKLVAFPDGHMSHIENRGDLLIILLAFFKSI